MALSTVNISFQKELLQKIDEAARAESRSRSELLREAARIYLERRGRWERIFSFGSALARKRHAGAADVEAEIRAFRARRARR